MPFGTPLFLIESGVYFENIHSHLPNNQIQSSISNNLIPPENMHHASKKKNTSQFEEEKVYQHGKPPKESNFEDKELSAAMTAVFGVTKKQTAKGSISETMFSKLGRSLSVDYKHKHKAAKISDASQDQFKRPHPHQLENIEEHFEGYTSDNNTDAASIDLLDKNASLILQRLKNRGRGKNRKLNRMKRQKLNH